MIITTILKGGNCSKILILNLSKKVVEIAEIRKNIDKVKNGNFNSSGFEKYI